MFRVGGLKEINTRMMSLGGLRKKEPLETVVREDLLVKPPLCGGLHDEKEQVMNKQGQALPNPVRAAGWGMKPESRPAGLSCVPFEDNQPRLQ